MSLRKMKEYLQPEPIMRSMSFWKENVERILEFNDQKVLKGHGTISNALMEKKVREIYSEFDSKRKAYEAKKADQEDLEELNRLSEKLKSNKKK